MSKKGGVQEPSNVGEEEEKQRSEYSETEISRLKNVAFLETWIVKLKNDLL